MTDLDRLMNGLDVCQPDWWIRFADAQDTEEYMRKTSPLPDTLGHDPDAIASCKARVKRNTGLRLMLVVNAAIQCGLVKAR